MHDARPVAAAISSITGYTIADPAPVNASTRHSRSIAGRRKIPGGHLLRNIAIIFAIGLAASLAGCRQDMQDQPKFVPQRGTMFFADGRSVRNQLPGTVARGQEQNGSYVQTGMSNGKEGDGFPFPVTLQVLERGQERFNIYCSPCHSRVGNGEGRVVQRGYYQAANFQSERLRDAPAGHFFSVITHGYGAMPDYHAELAPVDRWAVIAYIRALQLSQDAKTSDAVPGANIVSLVQLVKEEGLPPDFAQENWNHPAGPRTAIPAITTASPLAPSLTASLSSSGPKSQDGAAGQGESKSQEKSTAGEEKPAGGKQPPPAAAGDAAAGKQLYTANCQMCHQANRQGLPPAIPSLEGIVTKLGAPHIRQTIINGVPTARVPMPSFAGKLSDADIDNLIAYLKTKP
jgi:mono/diheme cytochrome c family protein